MTATIGKWGSSLAVRVPAPWIKENKIKEGDQIELIIDRTRITILPKKKKLADMLRMMDEDSLYPEIETGNPEGEEAW